MVGVPIWEEKQEKLDEVVQSLLDEINPFWETREKIGELKEY